MRESRYEGGDDRTEHATGRGTEEHRPLERSAWDRSRRHTVLVVIAIAVAAALVLPFVPAFLG